MMKSSLMPKSATVCGFTIVTLCLLACGRTPLGKLENSPRLPDVPSLEDGGPGRDSAEAMRAVDGADVGRPDGNVADVISSDLAFADSALPDAWGFPDASMDAAAAKDSGFDGASDTRVSRDAAAAKDSGFDDASDTRVSRDAVAAKDSGFDDASDTRLPCTVDTECNDGIACTADECKQGFCRSTPHSERCDDGIFCNGQEICSTSQGCLAGSPPCSDGVSCTVVACQEGTRSCSYTPNDLLCPVSHACDAALGCQARAFAIDNLGNVLDVRLPSGITQPIGPSGGGLTDIALAPDGRLFGVDFGAASEIDATTGRATTLSTFTPTNINAMDAAPDGTIYVAGGQDLYTLDLASGALVLVMSFSQGRSSGDLAFVNGRLLLTISGYALHDYLLELDPVAHTSQIVGDTGYDCIYGLAAYGPKLYGMTCAGQVLSLDTDTGKGTVLQETNIVFWGGSAR
jgi:hypothetical protein